MSDEFRKGLEDQSVSMHEFKDAPSAASPSFLGARPITSGSGGEVLPVLFWDFGNDNPDEDGLFFCCTERWDIRPADRVMFGITDGDESFYEYGTVREVGETEGYRWARIEGDRV